MKTTLITKTLKIEEDFCDQLETLCVVMNTGFATKAKELLMEWKIKELKRLREDAPEMHKEYGVELAKKKTKPKVKTSE